LSKRNFDEIRQYDDPNCNGVPELLLVSTAPRIVATIEARMTSSRLPGKVLKEAVGKTMLELMVERLKRVPRLDGIVIATTVNETDDPIVELARRHDVGCFRGSEDDVLLRVLKAAQFHNIDIIVQTTGDCPLIDPALVQDCIDDYLKGGADYVSNRLPRSFPIGMDTQVFATSVLAEIEARCKEPDDREHVSLAIYTEPTPYRLRHLVAPAHLTNPGLALTLDTAEDYAVIKDIFEALYQDNPEFDLADMLLFLDQNPQIAVHNSHIRRKSE
jgi:spore coat polysaccharide biosynthesis protein SpsF